MNPFSKQFSAWIVAFSYTLQLMQPAFAREVEMDVYPAPPLPPSDAFTPQWRAPEPTLTGRSQTPAAVKFTPAALFKGFSTDANLAEVDSAAVTVVPLGSSRKDKAKPLRDEKLKEFLKTHQARGGVTESASVAPVQSFLAENPDSQYRYTLLMELADAQWRHGWFMKSAESYRQAWDLGKAW